MPSDAPDHILIVVPTVFKRHLASHLEQLALFAIPIGSAAEGDVDSNVAIEEDVGALPGGSDLSTLAFDSSRPSSPASKGRSSDDGPITEGVVKAAAGNEESGGKVMRLLLDRRGDEIRITEEVVKAAAENERSGGEVMRLLLDRRRDDVRIAVLGLEPASSIWRRRTGIKGDGRRPKSWRCKYLASTFSNQGRWKEAEELLVQVMETSLRMLGEEYPSTLTGMANLASTYRNQGRWKEAEELEVQVMETSLRVPGEGHPDTLTGMANLALTFWNQGRWKDAEEREVQVMETSLRVLGEEHPDTVISMWNLASTWKAAGRNAEAVQLLQKCVGLQTQTLGGNHPYTVSSSAMLVEWQTRSKSTARQRIHTGTIYASNLIYYPRFYERPVPYW
jgi:hypothetical protein